MLAHNVAIFKKDDIAPRRIYLRNKLEKASEYMDKIGISINVLNHIKRNMNFSDVGRLGGVICDKIQHPFVI